MKKLLLLSTAILFISCSKKDLKQEQIEAKISENAMGNDLKYEPIATKEISQVTYQDILDSYFKELEITPEPIEEAINRTNFVIDKAQQEDDKETFKLFNFKLERLKSYQSVKDKKAIAYKIFEHKYSIRPLQNDFKATVTNYYFFDNSDKLLGYVDEEKYKECKDEYIMHSKAPYEYMLFEIK